MLWFIIFGLIAFASLILLIASIRIDEDGGKIVGGFFFVFSVIVLIIMTLTQININAKFEATVNEIENTRMLVNSYNGQDYGNVSDLTSKVIRCNDKIAQHKAFCNNPWSGLWHSEKIGNLEPIIFNQ